MKTQKRAFTLAELMISMALVALIMTAAAIALHAAATSHAYNIQKTELVIKARGVLDRIARDVRLSVSFNVPDDRTVEITLPDGTVHSYVWDGADGGNLTYLITEGETTTSVVLTNGVAAFAASADDSPACGVSITIEGDKASASAILTTTPRKLMF